MAAPDVETDALHHTPRVPGAVSSAGPSPVPEQDHYQQPQSQPVGAAAAAAGPLALAGEEHAHSPPVPELGHHQQHQQPQQQPTRSELQYESDEDAKYDGKVGPVAPKAVKAVVVGSTVVADPGPKVDKCFIPGSRRKSFSQLLESTDHERLLQLKAHLAVDFISGFQPHEALLRRLFHLAFPTSPSLGDGSRVSPMWRELGFQRDDPATDMRGAGVMAIQCMIYFAENYPADFHSMAHADYGLSLLVMNITHMLKFYLNLTAQKRSHKEKATAAAPALCAPSVQRNFAFLFASYPTAFMELVCWCAVNCDKRWTLMKAKKPSTTLLEFTHILQRLPHAVHKALRRPVLTLEDLRAKLTKI